MSYVFHGEDVIKSETSWFTDDGHVFTVTIPAGTFAAKKPGVYRVFAILTGTGVNLGLRKTIDLGTITLKANPALAQAGEEALTLAERMVRKLEAILLTMSDTDIVSYSVAGRSVQHADRMSVERELAKWDFKKWRQKHPGKFSPEAEVWFRSAQNRSDLWT